MGVKFFNYFCGLNSISCKGTRQTHEETERKRERETTKYADFFSDWQLSLLRAGTDRDTLRRKGTDGGEEGYAGEESKQIRVKSPVEHCINLRQSAITCYFISCFRLSSPRGSLCVCVC